MASLFFISESRKASPTNGLFEIDPSTRQIFVYENGNYLPLIADDGVMANDDYHYPVTIFFNGVNVTNHCIKNGLTVKNIINQNIDTCIFTVGSDDQEILPSVGQSVQVWYKETDINSIAQRIFYGEIIRVDTTELISGTRKFNYNIQAADYSRRLKAKAAVQSYTDTKAGAIIKNLIDTYFPGEFTYNNVQDGSTIDSIKFNYKYVYQCIKELADITGYIWYVDENKDINFVSKETNTAPYSLTENNETTGNYRNLTIKEDKTQIRNKIIVRGGYYLSETYDQIRSADGDQTSFNLDYFPHGDVQVYVDTGGGYVEKTLGIDGIHQSGYDFVLNYKEKVVKNLDIATLSSGDLIKIVYQYEIEVLTEDRDPASIANRISEEGGDGVYEYVVVNSAINTLDAAHSVAAAMLELYANPFVTGNFETKQYGYKGGQLLAINMPNWGYSTQTHSIQSVTFRMLQSGKFTFFIDFGNKARNMSLFLGNLIDGSQEIIVRENETLNTLEVLPEESISISVSNADALGGSSFVWGTAIVGESQGA